MCHPQFICGHLSAPEGFFTICSVTAFRLFAFLNFLGKKINGDLCYRKPEHLGAFEHLSSRKFTLVVQPLAYRYPAKPNFFCKAGLRSKLLFYFLPEFIIC